MIYESTKKYNYQILSYMNDVKKYSICHGNGINDHLLDGLKANPPIIKNYPNKDTFILLFQKMMQKKRYYKQIWCRRKLSSGLWHTET